MILRDVRSPTAPIPFDKPLKIVAIVDSDSPPTMALIEAQNFEVEIRSIRTASGSSYLASARDQNAQPMPDCFIAFQESFKRFPGFNYEVQEVFQERVNGRIKFHTYVVRQ